MKLAGSILIILATSLIGAGMAVNLERQYEELKYIRQLLYQLQSEIKYSRSFLSEAFRSISQSAQAPYDKWMRELSLKLEQKSEGSLGGIWCESIDTYLKELKIATKQKEQLKDLGNYLGNVDADIQIKHIDMLCIQLELKMNEMRKELEEKKKLCRCLGVMSGIFIVIILI